jgi:protein-tyrosine phosphatase
VRKVRRSSSIQAEEVLRGISHRIEGLHAQARKASHGGDASRRFRFVIVCTGNRFRSPLAAAVVEQLVPEPAVEVSSLGTLDLHGAPPLKAAVKEAERFGLDLSGHRANTLVGADLRGADLVVGFERAHVGSAVLEAEAPRERSFLLTELVDLLDPNPPADVGDPVLRARAAVSRAEEARQEGPSEWHDEIPDPLGGSARVAREVAADVQRLTAAVVQSLFGIETPAPPDRSRRWRR